MERKMWWEEVDFWQVVARDGAASKLVVFGKQVTDWQEECSRPYESDAEDVRRLVDHFCTTMFCTEEDDKRVYLRYHPYGRFEWHLQRLLPLHAFFPGMQCHPDDKKGDSIDPSLLTKETKISTSRFPLSTNTRLRQYSQSGLELIASKWKTLQDLPEDVEEVYADIFFALPENKDKSLDPSIPPEMLALILCRYERVIDSWRIFNSRVNRALAIRHLAVDHGLNASWEKSEVECPGAAADDSRSKWSRAFDKYPLCFYPLHVQGNSFPVALGHCRECTLMQQDSHFRMQPHQPCKAESWTLVIKY
jgi:hypothetical protein